ncbi:MAG: hypothetical protein JWO46_681, partial [Nocardioidaceae bacterium]|nr:hypothetical protein [Nocardioidaceae bacterium]
MSTQQLDAAAPGTGLRPDSLGVAGIAM